jgi:hypothetical protein
MFLVRFHLRAGLALAAVLASPAAALAMPLTGVGVFQNATPIVKVIILGLVGATIAAVAVCGMKLASGPRLAGGSAYLSGLRLGGPLAGFVGAAYGALNMSIGLANAAAPVPSAILARGVAEVMMLVFLGLVAGSVAVIANWAVDARIDRAVLRD